MQYAPALLLSRPFLDRVPDQSLIVSDAGTGAEHVQATRDRAGSYALIYLPAGKEVELDLSRLAGEQLVGYWYNPRNGPARPFATRRNEGRMRFTPPHGGPDWVLVLDDATAGYPFPGTRYLCDRHQR